VHAVRDGDPTAFVRDLLANDADAAELEVRRASLEDTYMALVQRAESGQSRPSAKRDTALDESTRKASEVQA
jgi:ABC-2 type transport system ATP-binding protein